MVRPVKTKAKRKKKKLNRPAGFTLIEILIYFAILMILIVVLFPILSRFLTYSSSYQNKMFLRSESDKVFQRLTNDAAIADEVVLLPDWGIDFIFTTSSSQEIRMSQTNSIGAGGALSGYGWFYQAGGLSLNCADLGVCASSNYDVIRVASTSCLTAASSTPISGYAYSGYSWSPVIGWLKWREADPTEPVYGVCENGTTNALSGYGWNDLVGWIHFNGSNYGVSDSTSTLVGDAWNDTIGWLRFDGSNQTIYLLEQTTSTSIELPILDPTVSVTNFQITPVGRTIQFGLGLADVRKQLSQFATTTIYQWSR